MDYIIFFVCVLLSALFSASEIAYFTLSDLDLKKFQKSSKRREQLIYKLRSNPNKLLGTILLGNNIVNIGSAALATDIAIRIFGDTGVGIATGITTFIILIFGEIVPKALAQANNKALAVLVTPFFYIFEKVLYPFLVFVEVLTKVIKKRIRRNEAEEHSFSENNLKHFTRSSVESGNIDYEQYEMIQKVLSFDDVQVDKLMTPLYKVVSLNADSDLDQVAHFAAHSGFSRFPVYEDEKTNIIGVIHVNTMFKILNSDKRELDIRNLMNEMKSVSEDAYIYDVFRRMQREKGHMYIVREKEDNSIIGIITLENILEHLVGDIFDETDKDEQEEKALLEK